MQPAQVQHDESVTVLDMHTTRCCVVGGGPGGMMLAILLARRGVPVTLLEAHPTFERDFRGDTFHTSILEILDEIGLAEKLHELPHVKMFGPTIPGPNGPFMPIDFRKLVKTKFPYILWMPQPVFLDFLAEQAKQFPSLRIVMGASVQRLLEENGRVAGVRYRSADGWHEVRATLTVGADGRFSRVRKLSGIKPTLTSAPVELLWFRLPRLAGDPEGTGIVSPRFGKGHILLMIDRADHWQVGLFFPAGDYPKLHAAGVDAVRQKIVAMEPRFAENVQSLTEWQQFNLLSVASSRCPRWHQPGLLLIGDAAHTMTPAAGAGIKYAIEDAVEAANVLTAPLLAGDVRQRDLREVQRRREWPTRVIQAFGAAGLRRIARSLKTGRQPLPTFASWLVRWSPLPRLFARFVLIGLWRVHVRN